jgi:hypothetical protein
VVNQETVMITPDREYEHQRLYGRYMEIKRLTQVLRETVARRFRPDEAVEAALANLEVEIELLSCDIRRQ